MGGFGLLGETLGHSFSPRIHALLGDYEYRLYPTAREDLPAFLRTGDFQGLNVTIPYKETVIPYCAELSPAAEAIGSVNTLLRRPDGSLFGDNTDSFGFARLLAAAGVDPRGKKCLVFGSGGASKTVRAVLSDRGAGAVVVVSRSGADNYENLSRHRDAALLVNTTPLGMFPNTGTMAADPADFPGCEAVLDVVYNPAKTALLLRAEELGIPAWNGLTMLAAQAKRAAELFLGRTIDDGVIASIAETIARETKNVALIGMPGCGKSRIGRALAARLGRDFLDLDEEFQRREGLSAGDCILREGEAAFRAKETAILADTAKASGRVLSTGGGVVTRPENYPLLRQNSTVVFLSRPLDRLAREGRPLSAGDGALEALYEKRLPEYRRFCDVEIPNEGEPDAVVNTILEVLEL